MPKILSKEAAAPPPDAPALTVNHGPWHGARIVPVNTLHHVVHLLSAAPGFAAWAGGWGRRYFQLLAVSELVRA